MIIYNYDEFTKEYLNESKAGLDPEATKIAGHDEYLIPANATTTKPPKTKTHEVAIYDNGWQKVADYRGMYKVNSSMEPTPITTIGSLDDGYVVVTESQAKKIYEDKLYYIIQDGELIINPNYDTEKLTLAKEAKYKEALEKAYLYQQNGTVEYKNCVFEMSDSNRKNLSDTEEALKLMGEHSTIWNDKDDNLIELTVEDIQYIRLNLILSAIQQLWIVKYPNYKTAINEAQTTSEVEDIVINYEV